jgi:hypothetical protein
MVESIPMTILCSKFGFPFDLAPANEHQVPLLLKMSTSLMEYLAMVAFRSQKSGL